MYEVIEVFVENDKTRHPFYRLLCDIEKCLNSGIYMPALGMALTIPDICGRIVYPKCKVSKFCYIAWYDEFQGHYDIHTYDRLLYEKHNAYLRSLHDAYDSFCDCGKKKQLVEIERALSWSENYCDNRFVGILGDAIYALRCSFLHAGGASDYDKRYSFDFIFGEVLWNGKLATCDLIEEVSCDDIRCHVNIDRLCKCLVRNGLVFFLDNFDAFSDMKFDVRPFWVEYWRIGMNPPGGALHKLFTLCDEDVGI